MKVLTILGTRPEIIRLSRIIPKLDDLSEQILVHTGQNYDERLSDLFFSDLGVRAPDHYLGAQGSFATQASIIFPGLEKIVEQEKPDRFLVLGDTNSSLGAVVAKRMGVPVYHMEAGNRCYDEKVPEETNRRLIDHCSNVLLPYTERSRQNLLAEGIPGRRIYVTGNPIFEVIQHYLGDQKPVAGKHILVTIHRQENVDVESRLRSAVAAFEALAETYGHPVIVSTHPRTRKRLSEFGVEGGDRVEFRPPMGFREFIELQASAFLVLTDSGTVQEECSILRKPVVVIRDTTERPETEESGNTIVAGLVTENILAAAKVACTTSPGGPPPEYVRPNVSDVVTKIVLGNYHR